MAAGSGWLDEDAYRELYEANASDILNYLLRLSAGNRPLAEDVLQETFLRAWTKAPEVNRGQDSLRPWLFTVARRILVDQYRRRAARPQEVQGAILDSQQVVDDDIDGLLRKVVVADALASLSPLHRDVLREVYFRGSQIPEASKALGVPPGTIKSRTYYALRALRLALAERGLTDGLGT